MSLWREPGAGRGPPGGLCQGHSEGEGPQLEGFNTKGERSQTGNGGQAWGGQRVSTNGSSGKEGEERRG